MGKPDALSRREDHTEGIEDDNKGVVVITPDKIRMTILITDEGDSFMDSHILLPQTEAHSLLHKSCRK